MSLSRVIRPLRKRKKLVIAEFLSVVPPLTWYASGAGT